MKCSLACWKTFSTRGEVQDKALKVVHECLKHIEGGLKLNGNVFNGETCGFLCIVANAIRFGMGVLGEAGGIQYYDPEEMLVLHSWIEGFRGIEVRQMFPSCDELVSYFRGRHEALLGSPTSS
ncbi:hypothetical protein AMTR_s00027p00228670 [Amborella trichopoda]|uniref:GST C-terminal domain-containing protein n=1 Tax=Amborella trichopoda TaxID=13333 RepID=W1PU31_AMBTC|nr:hypothetical protein AMTR_s00027p00228670 [Amborella trichopoda]